jgi:hypothetical protein
VLTRDFKHGSLMRRTGVVFLTCFLIACALAVLGVVYEVFRLGWPIVKDELVCGRAGRIVLIGIMLVPTLAAGAYFFDTALNSPRGGNGPGQSS